MPLSHKNGWIRRLPVVVCVANCLTLLASKFPLMFFQTSLSLGSISVDLVPRLFHLGRDMKEPGNEVPFSPFLLLLLWLLFWGCVFFFGQKKFTRKRRFFTRASSSGRLTCSQSTGSTQCSTKRCCSECPRKHSNNPHSESPWIDTTSSAEAPRSAKSSSAQVRRRDPSPLIGGINRINRFLCGTRCTGLLSWKGVAILRRHRPLHEQTNSPNVGGGTSWTG